MDPTQGSSKFLIMNWIGSERGNKLDYKVDFASAAEVWNLQVSNYQNENPPKFISYLLLKSKKLFKAICIGAVDSI